MRSGAPGALLMAGALVAVAAGSAPGQPQDLVSGRRVYEEHCAVCHGVNGDGRGHAAHHFATAPRDFTTGRYKLRSTGSGQLPTDGDLTRSILEGMPGTAMVPQNHLSATEVAAVIEYLKSLSPKFSTGSAPPPLPIPPEPARASEALARGRKVYEKAECHECHGREGRGDGPSAKDLKVKPSDLTRRPFKGGATARDIFRAIITGFDGTPMPSYHLILDDHEIWELAHYVDSLGRPPEVTEDERAGWQVVRHHQRRTR